VIILARLSEIKFGHMNQRTLAARLCAAMVIAAGLLATPALARAQSTAVPPDKIPDPRTETHLHVGPIYLKPQFLLKDLGVDTNVFNSATDPRSDFTMTLSPSVKAQMPIRRRALFSTTLTGGLVYFAKYSAERSFDPEVLVRGDLFARRMTFYGENSFQNTRQRPSLEIDARSRHRTNQAAVGFAVRLTSKLGVDMGAYRRTTTYDQDEIFFGTRLSTALNRSEEGLKLQVRDRLTSRTTLTLTSVTSKIRFEAPESKPKNADGFRIEPGVELAPTALISGKFSLGFRKLDGLSPTLPDFHGLVAATRLGYTLLGATNFEATWSRDVDFSFEALEPYYVLGVFGGRVRRQLVRSFDLGLTATRSTHKYESIAVPAPLVKRLDVTKYVGLDVGYRLNRDTRFALAIGKQSRDSNVSVNRDYRQWKIGTTITYAVQ
jgi:hypothetical protein